MIELETRHLEAVREILRRHVPDRAVWAFGSRVTAGALATSDLDLAIEGEEPIPLASLGALREAFAESDLPFFVDVVDMAVADEAFRQRIIEKRVRICEPDVQPS